MKNSVPVAKATEQVSNPVEFTGVIKSVNRITTDNGEWVALDIDGLPELVDENGRKVNILRSVEQVKADLRYFATPNMSLNTAEMTLDGLAKGRPVTLNVSAHQKGAKYTATAQSKAVLAGEASVGDILEAKSAGFTVDGFLNIDFAKADIMSKLQQIEEAQAKTNAVTF